MTKELGEPTRKSHKLQRRGDYVHPYNHKPRLMFFDWLAASLLAGPAYAEYRAPKDEVVQLGTIASKVESVSFYIVSSCF
ncbi:hypothetical protein RKE25_05235 [Dyella sp. BiH032]|uniref:hypothetical protein n=1 Tax=Dyella sp. BiH032 TaxID=3075430 RepID=UPI002892E44E|nr:hypothetical protein [Dyella sp. BiH032]WNL47043.1 hypothetical protein RKE25_05235 [Dyella sp. BiH032]